MCGFMHVNNKQVCSNVYCWWLWKKWQLFSIKINGVMLLFEEMVIGFKFIHSIRTFHVIVANNTNYIGCDCEMCYFVCRRCYLLKCCCLEGWNGQPWKEHMHDCASCHLYNVDGKNWPIVGYCHYECAMYIVWAILEETTILICDWCSTRWHMGCFVTPLEKTLVRKCFFPWCTK